MIPEEDVIDPRIGTFLQGRMCEFPPCNDDARTVFLLTNGKMLRFCKGHAWAYHLDQVLQHVGLRRTLQLVLHMWKDGRKARRS